MKHSSLRYSMNISDSDSLKISSSFAKQDFLQKVKVGHLQMLFIIKVSVETAVTAAATM